MHRWAEAKFGGRSQAFRPESSVILHIKPEHYKRRDIEGHKFLIGDRTFTDGIAMRRPGEVEVDVPDGAARFEAVLGVDSNDIGYYSNAGRGSVVASVTIGGREVYRSPVLHEGLAGIPLNIDLQGTHRFSLRLESTGDKPPTYQAEWDQADWADAAVLTAENRSTPLSAIPIGPLPDQDSTDAPFSFQLGGKPSSALLGSWIVEREQTRLDDRRTEYRVRYSNPVTAFSARVVAIVYSDFPTVEWTLYLKNNSKTPSEMLTDIRPLHTGFRRGNESDVLLHHSKGSMSLATDFQPLIDNVSPGYAHHFSSRGGRPTDGDMPYFNLAWRQRGILFALGWPGQWDVNVARERAESIRITGGQSSIHFRLLPGEEVRTPLAVLQFWSGDWIDGQNLWRQWMIEHNLPRPSGKLPPPQIAAGSAHFTVEMQEATEANQRGFLQAMLDQGLPIDHWWMDAGWYRYEQNWSHVGTWEIDKKRFPKGLKPITDLAHERGVKSILWFEPERVTPESQLAEEHPEWLVGSEGKDELLFLGNANARRWLVNHVSKLIEKQGIDVYRQDFNFEPLSRWQANDTPDRQGISEIRHVEGYLSYFDELRKRFPNLLIDTCASGGRRLDLETLRRAVPLWRSDYPFGAAPMQMQTYGLALWVPYFGTSAGSLDRYTFLSEITPAISIGPDPKMNSERLQLQLKLISEWREIAPFYYGNFYPLTSYSSEETSWMAWQWSETSGKAGIVQAFRRNGSAFTSAVLRLRGLTPDATYSIEDLDSAHKYNKMSGKELMDSGLPVSIENAPGAVTLKYSAGQ